MINILIDFLRDFLICFWLTEKNIFARIYVEFTQNLREIYQIFTRFLWRWIRGNNGLINVLKVEKNNQFPDRKRGGFVE